MNFMGDLLAFQQVGELPRGLAARRIVDVHFRNGLA